MQRSSGEAAYHAVMEAIRRGDYVPGARLREEEVGARLDLSRTPVREALRRLEAEGIVEHRPRAGAVVRQLSHAELVELYEMRVVLERTAAELAARHGTAAEFDTLAALNRQIAEERSNPAQAAAINQAFHRGLYLASRNRFLLDAARGLNNALLLLGPRRYRPSPMSRGSIPSWPSMPPFWRRFLPAIRWRRERRQRRICRPRLGYG